MTALTAKERCLGIYQIARDTTAKTLSASGRFRTMLFLEGRENSIIDLDYVVSAGGGEALALAVATIMTDYKWRPIESAAILYEAWAASADDAVQGRATLSAKRREVLSVMAVTPTEVAILNARIRRSAPPHPRLGAPEFLALVAGEGGGMADLLRAGLG